jgi:hypothetical protein
MPQFAAGVSQTVDFAGELFVDFSQQLRRARQQGRSHAGSDACLGASARPSAFDLAATSARTRASTRAAVVTNSGGVTPFSAAHASFCSFV